jgi:hypothetical protein
LAAAAGIVPEAEEEAAPALEPEAVVAEAAGEAPTAFEETEAAVTADVEIAADTAEKVPAAEVNGDAGPSAEELELLKLEEELAALEREEQQRREAAQQTAVDVSSDDLWQIDEPLRGEEEPEEAGVLRFAEDIAGFRDQGEGRRRRGGGARRRGGRR